MMHNLSSVQNGQIKEIHNQLTDGIKQEWNSIPESVFVQEFLDMFVSGVGDNLVRFENWIKVVGNLRFGLHITDDQTGEPLFVVPPLYDTSALNPVPGDSDQESIAKHAAVYDTLLRARPQQAQRYFQTNMSRVMSAKFSHPKSDNWKQFQFILDRYKVESSTEKPVEEKASTSLVYDDSDII